MAYLKAREEFGEEVQEANDAIHEGHRHFDEVGLALCQLKQELALLQSCPCLAGACTPQPQLNLIRI